MASTRPSPLHYWVPELYNLERRKQLSVGKCIVNMSLSTILQIFSNGGLSVVLKAKPRPLKAMKSPKSLPIFSSPFDVSFFDASNFRWFECVSQSVKKMNRKNYQTVDLFATVALEGHKKGLKENICQQSPRLAVDTRKTKVCRDSDVYRKKK